MELELMPQPVYSTEEVILKISEASAELLGFINANKASIDNLNDTMQMVLDILGDNGPDPEVNPFDFGAWRDNKEE